MSADQSNPSGAAKNSSDPLEPLPFTRQRAGSGRRSKPQLISRGKDDPESIDEATERAEQAAVEKGYHSARHHGTGALEEPTVASEDAEQPAAPVANETGPSPSEESSAPTSPETPAAAHSAETQEPARDRTSERIHFPVPRYIYHQLQVRKSLRSEKSLKSYLLRFLRDAGEIDIDEEDIADQRGKWIRDLVAKERGEG